MKKTLILVSMILFAISCSEESLVREEKSPLDIFLNSQKFQKLNQDVNYLDLENNSLQQSGRNTYITVPHKNGKIILVGLIDQKGKVISASKVSYFTHLSSEQLSSSLKSGDFSGEVEVAIVDRLSLSFSFDRGKVNLENNKFNDSGKIGACESTAAVLSCALGMADAAVINHVSCAIFLQACMATYVIACIDRGCYQQ